MAGGTNYGFWIGLIVFLVAGAYFGNNYIDNTTYDDLFNQCQEFCISHNETYMGINNIKESDRTCVCNHNKYPVYRVGRSDFNIIKNTKE